MLERYGTRTRETLRILTAAYAEGRFELEAEDLDAVVAHSEAFNETLPVTMRAAVVLVVRLFEAESFFVRPAFRSLAKKTTEEQRRAYERWFARPGYITTLLGQLLHLTFLGSLYSLPKVHRAIGYERVRSVR